MSELRWGGERLLVVFHESPLALMLHTNAQQHSLVLAVGGFVRGSAAVVDAGFHPAKYVVIIKSVLCVFYLL